MGSVEPSQQQLEAFVGFEDDGDPIVMINLLRYRDRAAYAAGAADEACSGREAYMRYGAVAGAAVARHGGEMVTGGPVRSCLIGPAGEEWDDFILVRYPSRQAFLDMVADPLYQACVHHRSAALADSRLIATKSGGLFTGK